MVQSPPPPKDRHDTGAGGGGFKGGGKYLFPLVLIFPRGLPFGGRQPLNKLMRCKMLQKDQGVDKATAPIRSGAHSPLRMWGARLHHMHCPLIWAVGRELTLKLVCAVKKRIRGGQGSVGNWNPLPVLWGGGGWTHMDVPSTLQ